MTGMGHELPSRIRYRQGRCSPNICRLVSSRLVYQVVPDDLLRLLLAVW
jgi:hypothetical protein